MKRRKNLAGHVLLNDFLESDCYRLQLEFARAVDCSESHLSTLRSGKKRPSLDLAARIERASNGAVPMGSWEREVEGCDA